MLLRVISLAVSARVHACVRVHARAPHTHLCVHVILNVYARWHRDARIMVSRAGIKTNSELCETTYTIAYMSSSRWRNNCWGVGTVVESTASQGAIFMSWQLRNINRYTEFYN